MWKTEIISNNYILNAVPFQDLDFIEPRPLRKEEKQTRAKSNLKNKSILYLEPNFWTENNVIDFLSKATKQNIPFLKKIHQILLRENSNAKFFVEFVNALNQNVFVWVIAPLMFKFYPERTKEAVDKMINSVL